jgi:hypothetical protein
MKCLRMVSGGVSSFIFFACKRISSDALGVVWRAKAFSQYVNEYRLEG